MNKDYYTKKEVDDLISQLKEELIDLLYSRNNTEVPIWFKLHSGRIPDIEYDVLYDGLSESGLIKGPKKMFSRVMIYGQEAKKHGIEWIGPQNLCVYMFDKLEDHGNIESSLIERKIEKIFGITRATNKKHKYSNTSTGLPRGYEKVDNALGPFFELLSLENIAHQDMLDIPDDYGLNDLP